MENTEDALAEIESARLAPYVAVADDPLWVWPAIGLMNFVFLASFEIDNVAVSIVAIIAYFAGIRGVSGFMARRRGVQEPMNPRRWPAALRKVMLAYAAAVAVGVVVVVGTFTAVNFVAGGLVAGVWFTVIGTTYSLRWRRWAERSAPSVAR